MKKLFPLLVALLLTACGTAYAPHVRDFNVDFKYGYSGTDNELNSFNDTYTKDMVMEDAITVPLMLSDEELASIQAKIEELDVFNEEIVDTNGITSATFPCIHYSLEIDKKGETQTAEWTCSDRGPKREEFVKFMFDLIDSHKEVQDLPEPQGGYM